MLFRQLFDSISCTYTYILAAAPGREALIIDPVAEKIERYLQLLSELNLRLVKAIDTHVHADHISALALLRDRTRCITVMGRRSLVDVVSMRVDEGDSIAIDGVELGVLYTPGHTDDSYCFTMSDRIFTGDTLLIRGTGRTDFQNGDSNQAYESLFGKLLRRSDDILVYPGHDYKGDTVSTIGEERLHNPRLQVSSAAEYTAIMNNLNLADPKMMDVAVPANLTLGLTQLPPEIAEKSLRMEAALAYLQDMTAIWIDLREDSERRRDGIIPNSIHVPYQHLEDALAPSSALTNLVARTSGPVIFYCAYGERSALALQAAVDAGLDRVYHLAGGMQAWIQSDAPREHLTPPGGP